MTEKEYYISLGYTEKEAEKILKLFEYTERESRPGLGGLFGRVLGAQPVGMANTAVKSMARVQAVQVREPVPDAAAVCEEAAVCSASACAPAAAFAAMPGVPSDILEAVRWDSYDSFEDSRFRNTLTSPTATFRTTYNTAAATVLVGNFRRNTNIHHDMVRTEELLNYADYSLEQPQGVKFAVTKELGKCGDKEYLFLGIQGSRALPAHQNIVMLLDTSGSMMSKKPQLRMALATVFFRMNEGDTFSVITYSDTDHLFIDGMKKSRTHDISYVCEKLEKAAIFGCTYGSKGIETAYDIVRENFVEGGVNRVIMVTDGDLNFGITSSADLKTLIEDKKKSGAFFSAIGTGLYNLQDDKLEALAKNGNGNYFVINSVDDAKKCLRDRYESLIYPIAVDVKAQVEFNPARVASYRLIGFENRQLSHEDFTNDAVIAETFGSGSSCIALFELKRGGEESEKPLKYQTAQLTSSGELATLSLRWKEIGETVSRELSFPVSDTVTDGKNLEKAVRCSELAEILKNSEEKGDRRRALREYCSLADCGEPD